MRSKLNKFKHVHGGGGVTAHIGARAGARGEGEFPV